MSIERQFVIAEVQPFIAGGLFIQFIFIDNPEDVFSAWVYSTVDEDAEEVLDYSVRSVSMEDEKNELSREMIFQLMHEHPELKLW